MYEKIVDETGSSVKNVVVVEVKIPSDDVVELEIGVNGIVIFGGFVVSIETLLLSVISVELLIPVTLKIGLVVMVLNVVVSSEDIVVLVTFLSASVVKSSIDRPVHSIEVAVEYCEVPVTSKLVERSVLVPSIDVVLVNGNVLLVNGILESVISLDRDENVLLNSIELKVEDDSSIVEVSIVIFGTYISLVLVDENGYFVGS